MINELIKKIENEFRFFGFDLKQVKGNEIELTLKDLPYGDLCMTNETKIIISLNEFTKDDYFTVHYKNIRKIYRISGKIVTEDRGIKEVEELNIYFGCMSSVIDWLRLNFMCDLECI